MRQRASGVPVSVWAASLQLRPISRHLRRGVAEVGEPSAAQSQSEGTEATFILHTFIAVSALIFVLGFNQLESDWEGPVANLCALRLCVLS